MFKQEETDSFNPKYQERRLTERKRLLEGLVRSKQAAMEFMFIFMRYDATDDELLMIYNLFIEILSIRRERSDMTNPTTPSPMP